MKHPKLWDGISSVLVLFGLGLYGSSCYYGIWALIYVALGVHRAGRGHCRAHTALPVLPRYLGMMFSPAKDVLPALRQRRARWQKRFDSAVIFRYAGCIMHVKAGIP